MKTTVENLNSVQKKIHIELPPEKVNKEFEKAYKKIQQQAHLKGFRPGKAPIEMIKKLYSHNVKPDIGESLINDSLRSAISDNQLKPVARLQLRLNLYLNRIKLLATRLLLILCQKLPWPIIKTSL